VVQLNLSPRPPRPGGRAALFGSPGSTRLQPIG